MKKNFRRTGKPTLPEIQEEGLLTPLRRGASFSAYAVAHHKLVTPSLRDLESGSDHNLHSNVEMAAALVDQVKSQSSCLSFTFRPPLSLARASLT
jgi:two pore calcium channel protein